MTVADTDDAPSAAGVPLEHRFRLDRLLGQGGQAEVWLAFDEELHELVALKLFEPSAARRARKHIRSPWSA